MATQKQGTGIISIHIFRSSLAIAEILQRAAQTAQTSFDVVYAARSGVVPFPSSNAAEPGVVSEETESSNGIRLTKWDSVAILRHQDKASLATLLRALQSLSSGVSASLHYVCGRYNQVEFQPIARIASSLGYLSYRALWQNIERLAIASGKAKVPPLETLLERALASQLKRSEQGYPENPPEKRFNVFDYGGERTIVENFKDEIARRAGSPDAKPRPKTMTTAAEITHFHRFASTWLFGSQPHPAHTPGSPGETVGMLNFLKFRPNGGDKSYDKYGRTVTPYAIRRGGLPVEVVGYDLKEVKIGENGELVEGEQYWDEVACMVYPSSYVFAEMGSSQGFKVG